MFPASLEGNKSRPLLGSLQSPFFRVAAKSMAGDRVSLCPVAGRGCRVLTYNANMAAKTKDPTPVAPRRNGGKRGIPARAAKLDPEQRTASARNAVQARWAKAKNRSDSCGYRGESQGS